MSVRCMICDWSPSNKQSLFNPNVAYSQSNKLFEDKHGDTLCYECISASEASFSGKKINAVNTLYDENEEGYELELGYDSAP